MMSQSELVAAISQLETDALQRWIDQGWVMPHEDSEIFWFDLSDVARVRLICELHYDLRIEDDSMPVVLSLLDQLYGARRVLGALVAAVEAEPDDIRSRITARTGNKL